MKSFIIKYGLLRFAPLMCLFLFVGMSLITIALGGELQKSAPWIAGYSLASSIVGGFLWSVFVWRKVQRSQH